MNIAGLVLQDKINNPKLKEALLDSSLVLGYQYLVDQKNDANKTNDLKNAEIDFKKILPELSEIEKEYLLKNIDTPLVLGLDDIDKIFPYPEIAQEFFALLRAWHENGKNEVIWQKLRLVIAHSQEVYVSLNVNQSPFNVGVSVEIGEFNATQIKELVQRHKLSWSDTQIGQLRGMIDGHPYLLRTALYQIATGNLTLEQFLKVAPTDEGLFRGFLHPYVSLLEEDKLLKAAFQKVINSEIPVKLDSVQTFKLRSLGLIEFKGSEVQCLCNLYRFYFRERLSE